MAKKPLRPCLEINCSKLTRETYCEEHKKETQKFYRENRNKTIDKFYRSKDWLAVRKLALERDNYLCRRCLSIGELKQADVVHHIIEIKTDWSMRLVLNNLESLCHACHNAHHKTSPRG